MHLPWSPALRAILWMDAVLLVAVALALAGKPPALATAADLWTWLALAGSTLTAMLAALSSFHVSAPGGNPAWTMLPVPAIVLWIFASALSYLTLPAGAEIWGDTPAEALECLGFLLSTGLPLLALIVFMLWRASSAVPRRGLAMSGLAASGAAASLLTLVHPHAGSAFDLCAHAAAITLMLGIGAAGARLRPLIQGRSPN